MTTCLFQALYFSGYARTVTLVVRGPNLERSMSHYLIAQLRNAGNVKVRFNSEVTSLAVTSWLPPQLERDKLGYTMTGNDVSPDCPWTHGRSRYLLKTSLPGIFAAGDVRSRSVKRVAAGVGEGSLAIAFVHQFLQAEMAGQPYQDRGYEESRVERFPAGLSAGSIGDFVGEYKGGTITRKSSGCPAFPGGRIRLPAFC